MPGRYEPPPTRTPADWCTRGAGGPSRCLNGSDHHVDPAGLCRAGAKSARNPRTPRPPTAARASEPSIPQPPTRPEDPLQQPREPADTDGMALLSCSDCGNPVSEAAPACPHCGRPGACRHLQASETREVPAGIALLFVGVWLVFAGGGVLFGLTVLPNLDDIAAMMLATCGFFLGSVAAYVLMRLCTPTWRKCMGCGMRLS